MKSAIVTGASRGIGEAAAKRLAADGFAVVVNYAGNAALAEKIVKEIVTKGGKAVAVKADISNETDVATLYAETKKAFGRVDVVVNSGGIMTNALMAAGNFADFDRTIAVNLRGTYLMMMGAALNMEKGGRFIALSSSVLHRNLPSYGAYVASKAGVEGLVRVFANEMRGRDITVNAVAPGPVATELFLDGKSKEQVEQIAKQAVMERLGTPEDIAGVISFLAGPDAGWVHGQIIRANGGFG